MPSGWNSSKYDSECYEDYDGKSHRANDDTSPTKTLSPSYYKSMIENSTVEEIAQYIEVLEKELDDCEKDVTDYKDLWERERFTHELLKDKYEKSSMYLRMINEHSGHVEEENIELKKRIANLVKVGVFPWSVDAPKVTNPADDRFTSIEIVSHDEIIEHKTKERKKLERPPKTDEQIKPEVKNID